jgi:hypothetical protein
MSKGYERYGETAQPGFGARSFMEVFVAKLLLLSNTGRLDVGLGTPSGHVSYATVHFVIPSPTSIGMEDLQTS